MFTVYGQLRGTTRRVPLVIATVRDYASAEEYSQYPIQETFSSRNSELVTGVSIPERYIEGNIADCNLVEFVRKLFSIPENTNFDSIPTGTSVVDVFPSESSNSPFGFQFILYKATSTSSVDFHVYDISRNIGIGYAQGHYLQYDSRAKILVANYHRKYSGNSFTQLLSSMKNYVKANESESTSNIFCNYLNYALFIPVERSWAYNDRFGYSINEDQNGSETLHTLENFPNWYTFITGKYFYGECAKLKLRYPAKGLEYIELSTPVSAKYRDNGKQFSTDTYNGNTPTTTNFRYVNVGTNIDYLFTNSSGNPIYGTIYLENGMKLIRENGGNNNSIYKLTDSSGTKGLFIRQRFARSQYENPNYEYDLGWSATYLMVASNYLNLSVSQWADSIPDEYSVYSYNNCPLTFVKSDTVRGTVNFFDYEEYPNFPIRAYMSNGYYNESSPYFASLFDLSFPIDKDFWVNLIEGAEDETGDIDLGEDSVGGGYSTVGGGHGTFDDSSDSITEPSVPSGYTELGLFFMHTVNPTNLGILGKFLHHDSLLADYTKYVNAVISLKMMWLPSYSDGSSENLYILGKQIKDPDTNTAMVGNQISARFKRYDLGSMKVDEYFGNFLDYAGYTTIDIFLPFVGTRRLDTNLIMNRNIRLSCMVDMLSGTITYSLRVADENSDSVLYTFTGDCSIDYPLTAEDYTGKVRASASIATSAVAGASLGAKVGGAIGTAPAPGAGTAAGAGVGGVLGAVLGAGAGLITSLAANAGNFIPTSTQTGNVTSSSGAMSVRVPYLIITRPKWSLPDTYASQVGYPSDISTRLGNCTGYTKVRQCHLNNFPDATAEELSDIEVILKSGIII